MRIILSFLLCSFFIPQVAAQQNSHVCLYTNVSEICLQLLPEAAPGTVDNFLGYVESGAYDGTVIHRSVPGFIIQGGGFYRDPLGDSLDAGAPIANEFGVSNTRATVAMAKLSGNPDSATSQWFINLADNSLNLDNQNEGFTVFAEVVRGMELADAIAGLPRYNLSNIANAAFTETPGIPVGDGNIELVTVLRARAFETLPTDPYSCSSAGKGNNLAEFCGDLLTIPVSVGPNAYQVSLRLSATKPVYELTAVNSSIRKIENFGQPFATFSNGELRIPNLKVNKQRFTNMVWKRVGNTGFVFTLESFDK